MKKIILTPLALTMAAGIANAQFMGFRSQPQDPSYPNTITAGNVSMTIDAGRGAKIISSNAAAESFNAKIKSFRVSLRGIIDEKFFLFRLANIYACPH